MNRTEIHNGRDSIEEHLKLKISIIIIFLRVILRKLYLL